MPAPTSPREPGGGVEPPREAEKAALRLQMRRQRAGMEPAERAARSRLIARSVLELLEARHLRVVLAFSSFGSEVSTLALINDLARAGSRILLPVVRERAILAADY